MEKYFTPHCDQNSPMIAQTFLQGCPYKNQRKEKSEGLAATYKISSPKHLEATKRVLI